jgi:hypothetical protein
MAGAPDESDPDESDPDATTAEPTGAAGPGESTDADEPTGPATEDAPHDDGDASTGNGRDPASPGRPRANRRLLFAGGIGVLVAILGFTAAQAVIDATGVRADAVLFVLLVFGVVGFASFVTLVSAFLVPR